VIVAAPSAIEATALEFLGLSPARRGGCCPGTRQGHRRVIVDPRPLMPGAAITPLISARAALSCGSAMLAEVSTTTATLSGHDDARNAPTAGLGVGVVVTELSRRSQSVTPTVTARHIFDIRAKVTHSGGSMGSSPARWHRRPPWNNARCASIV
jgi:hypothetical protein